MDTVVKTLIVRIDNSQGIRIPKMFLDQLGFGTEVELAREHDQLVLRPAQRPRQGWEQQFRAMAERGDDTLLDAESGSTTWDGEAWT